MKKLNLLRKIGFFSAFAMALSIGACNSPAPETTEEETTEQETTTSEEHDHDHATDEEHPASEEHPTGGGGSEHPN